MSPILLAIAALVLSASVTRADEAPAPGDISPLLLNNVAWVRAATKVCVEEYPSISGYLVAAYDAWLEQNPQLKPLIAWLDESPASSNQAEIQSRYRKAYLSAFRIFDDKRKYDPDDLANQCDTTTKELAEGFYDVPKPAL
jgi:hypothetical protein